MKKIVLSLAICAAFSAQAETVLTGNIGSLDAHGADTMPSFGVSMFQANGKGEMGFGAGFDFAFGKTEFMMLERKEKVGSVNFGLSYGIKSNLYIVPSIGLTYVDWEAEKGINNASGDEFGYNFGADLVYLAKNGFSMGFGVKQHELTKTLAYTQFGAKIGYAF